MARYSSIFLLRLTIVYIFLHWSLKLYSGVLKPSYQHALLLTSLLVYYELRIICFVMRKFYLFLVITSPVLLRIVSSWMKFKNVDHLAWYKWRLIFCVRTLKGGSWRAPILHALVLTFLLVYHELWIISLIADLSLNFVILLTLHSAMNLVH